MGAGGWSFGRFGGIEFGFRVLGLGIGPGMIVWEWLDWIIKLGLRGKSWILGGGFY